MNAERAGACTLSIRRPVPTWLTTTKIFGAGTRGNAFALTARACQAHT